MITAKGKIPVIVARLVGAEISDEKETGCPRLKLANNVYILSKTIIKKSNVIHDCKGARCRLVEQARTERVEQQNIVSTRVFLKHNAQHKTYLLNIYSIR